MPYLRLQMLRLAVAIGDGDVEPDVGGTSDLRPVWSGDGGSRCVGDGDGRSVAPAAAWSTPSWMLVVDAPVVVSGVRYLCGSRYWEAVSGFV